MQQADLQDPTMVLVTVHYSCLPPGPGNIPVQIDQNGPQGFGSETAICDGANHTTTVMVMGGPFVPGSAAAVGGVTNLTFTSAAEVFDEINLR